MALRPLSPREIAAAVAARIPSQVAAVYLFGSQARGTARPDSDVDLGLLYVDPPESTLLAQPFLLEAELSVALGRPVQCVVMNEAPPDLVHRILRDQQLLLDRDPALRVRFEVAARNRYFDLKPFLDRYRRRTRVA
ncbi:MAG TPA: nucleotidyltransferase domain-containing protein [Polyangiaceae bacterium]|jgi:predicted nucleotidyltransferase|nr:nucleotidyltransferase domain-containing protein [Polyangiaceae bacterium]